MQVASDAMSWDRGATARRLSTTGKIATAVGLLGLGTVPWLGPVFVFGMVLVVASYVVPLAKRSRLGSIEVRDDVVVVRRDRCADRAIPRRALASAYVVERRGNASPVVEIETRSGDRLSARMADAASARAVVDALGFGPGGRRVRIDLAQPVRRILHPAIGILAYVMGTIGLVFLSVGSWGPRDRLFNLLMVAVWVFGMALAYAFMKRFFAAPQVTIGDDGIAVRMRLRTTVIPRADLVHVAPRAYGGPLVFSRKSGRSVVANAVMVDEARCDAVARITAERLFHVNDAPLRAAAFERGGRDVAAWRAQLRAALDAGYRDAGASVDDAAAVLASAAATPEQRVGAALALRVAGESPERVRVAAEATVDPRLRGALDAIADDADDDRRVGGALAKLRIGQREGA